MKGLDLAKGIDQTVTTVIETGINQMQRDIESFEMEYQEMSERIKTRRDEMRNKEKRFGRAKAKS